MIIHIPSVAAKKFPYSHTYFVLQEADGSIIGVAPDRRRSLATEWSEAKPGRKVTEVYECT